jgi:Protein of unknown function (DUF1488)
LDGSGLHASRHSDNSAIASLGRPSERYGAPSVTTARWFPSRSRRRRGDGVTSVDHMIDFPNHSRSYDQTRRAVRFWGHDSAIEASFYIEADALRRIQPDVRADESGLLDAFDSNRDLICAAAARLYVRGSRGSYDLVAANF